MKKKSLIISIGSLLACSLIAVTYAANLGGYKLFQRTKGTDDYYSISISATDITDYTESAIDGSFVAHTDQLNNPVAFAFENARYSLGDEAVYIDQNEEGFIYNPYEAGGENEIRSMESVTVTGYGTFYFYWGFEKNGAIEYLAPKQLTINPSYEFDFDGDKPNYLKIASGNKYSAPYIKGIVIKYGKSCQSGENPYVANEGILYKKHADYAEVMGFSGSPLTDVVIAKQIGGVNVTRIAESAFESQSSIVSAYIPNTISSMSDAFKSCANLETVTFEAGGEGGLYMDGTFNGCSKLTSLTLPKRACNYQYNFNYYTFYDLGSLETIAIEDNYEGYYRVIDNVLYGNNGATLYLYPAKRAGSSFTVPANVTRIHDAAIRLNKNLETLVLQNTNQLDIDNYALSWCEKLTNIQFNGSGAVKLYWNPLRDFKGYLVLPANTIIDARGLGQLGDGARVFFEASEPLDSWSSDWAVSKHVDSENVKFYFYSENEPVGDAPEGADGFWHRVGEDNAPRVWSDQITIQSNAEFSADGTWYAVWAWTKGQDNGAFYYDANAPVNYKYTINVPTDKNCFIILRMKSGVDAGSISSFPEKEVQFFNRSDDLINVALCDATIVQWDNGMGYGNLGITWK